MATKVIVISSYLGGTGIGTKASEEHQRIQTVWVGEAGDRAIGSLRILLVLKPVGESAVRHQPVMSNLAREREVESR
jgi:hypothetical protein